MDNGMRFETGFDDGKLVWVTRTAPHNLLTARRLRTSGFSPLVQPVLLVRPTSPAEPIAVPDALVFTSLQGVRLHRFFPSLASLPVFAVGDHSARFAKLRGYRKVASAGGDVHDLRKLIRNTLPRGARILHFSAAQPAGNLLEMLREDGLMARRICVYETVEATSLDLEQVAGKLPQIGSILIHSPRSGLHIAHWLYQQMPAWDGMAVCISSAAALPFRELASVQTLIAARPNEAALLATLERGSPQTPSHQRQ